MSQIEVSLGSRSYPIHCDSGMLARSGELMGVRRVIIITDATVAPLYLEKLQASLDTAGTRHDAIVLAAGEGTKSFAGLQLLLDQIFALHPDRRTTLIALGGGVIGDITGFAASIVLRGIPFVQIPTTLLAQVDSSVGGKTGINSSFGKNTIGSFYQPKAVLIDTDTLATLPIRQLKAGYAEMVKYALIGDPAFFAWLEEHGAALLAGDEVARKHAILVSCQAKADIVALDEREQSGVRALLNLGHSFAHALEAETSFSDKLLHGEAVAIGMVLAFELSEKLGFCEADQVEKVTAHLKKMGLMTRLSDVENDWNVEALLGHMAHDKKATDGQLNLVLTRRIGDAFLQENVSQTAARDVLAS